MKTKSVIGRKAAPLILAYTIIVMMIGAGLGKAFASLGTSLLQSAMAVSIFCIIMWPVGYLFSRIWAESEFGKGSTFSFILPVT